MSPIHNLKKKQMRQVVDNLAKDLKQRITKGAILTINVNFGLEEVPNSSGWRKQRYNGNDTININILGGMG